MVMRLPRYFVIFNRSKTKVYFLKDIKETGKPKTAKTHKVKKHTSAKPKNLMTAIKKTIRTPPDKAAKVQTIRPTKVKQTKDAWEKREIERLKQQEELDKARTLYEKYDDTEYHEDMTAYLEDVRHDEVAKSSWWKRSNKHAAQAYNKAMLDEQRMYATDQAYRSEASGMYRISSRKRKRRLTIRCRQNAKIERNG